MVVIFGFIPGHPLGCICLSFSVLLSGARKIRSCGSCMVEEFVSDSWQNPSGYFSLVLFSLPVSIGFNGTGFVMAGFLRLSVHLRRSSSFMAFAHMVWRYSSRQRMAESFLVEQTLSSCCSLHGGYLSHVFSLWCFQARLCLVIVLESHHTSEYLKAGRYPVFTVFWLAFIRISYPSGRR